MWHISITSVLKFLEQWWPYYFSTGGAYCSETQRKSPGITSSSAYVSKHRYLLLPDAIHCNKMSLVTVLPNTIPD